jgi:hypothetical protein
MGMMKTIELVGQVDEHHRLLAQVPADVPPGPVKLSLMVSSAGANGAGEDPAGSQWASGVSREWAEELSDSRQDIYTLADGEPVNEAG